MNELKLKMMEIQPRLSQLFRSQQGVVQVTYGRKSTPVVALVPWQHYIMWRKQAEAEHVTLVPDEKGMHDTEQLFLSYMHRLEPQLRGNGNTIRVVVVTVHKEPVGAVLAWQDWLRFGTASVESASVEEQEQRTLDSRTYTIVSASKHLSQFPAQFAEEQKHGISASIPVTWHGKPVLAILPWDLCCMLERLQGRDKPPVRELGPDVRPWTLLIHEITAGAAVALEAERVAIVPVGIPEARHFTVVLPVGTTHIPVSGQKDLLVLPGGTGLHFLTPPIRNTQGMLSAWHVLKKVEEQYEVPEVCPESPFK